ncbi:hypothetical protein Tco_0236998 [Tanacetum coccineum]
MADAEHAPAMAPPVRTDEQILPRIRWVPIGKSNCYLNEEKSQPSPIYKIAVDILKQTNFFRAFTASSTIPAIYIQQFWDTICFDSKAGSYKCQLDEQWFDLTQDTLRDALQITQIYLVYPQSSQKTRGIWHNKLKEREAIIILIPSIRFTKLIIFHLQRLHNFHPRPESLLHLPTEEPVLAKPANKPNKANQQSKPTEPKAASKKPKPAPAKPQEKKRKPVSESSEAPPLAKRAKAGKVVKKRTVKSSKQLVDEFVDEGVPAAKPNLEDTEEAILQKVLEESLTDAYPTRRGPLPPVVFREPDTGKLQPLPEVPGKGKEKVGEEQAAQVLLHLQTPKKKSPTEQYIFQRRSHVPTETAGREDSTSLYAELGLSGSDTESDEEMPSVVRSGAQDEGQAVRPEEPQMKARLTKPG